MSENAAPAVVIDQHAPTAQADTMEATITQSLSQSLAPEERTAAVEEAEETPNIPIAGERPRDPATGKFLAQAPVVDGQPVVVEPEVVAPVIPEGFVAAKALPPEKAQGFKVRDAEGEILAPDLTWEFTANGKPRQVDTATLMQYAMHGVYNHEREQSRVQTERQSNEVIAYARQLEQAHTQNQQYIARLLSDPDHLIRELTRYEQENTPEARQAQERQKLEQDRQSFQLQQMQTQSEQYVAGSLEPAVDTIIRALPTVSKEEIAAKLFVVADRYRVQGVLHPEGYTPVGQALVNDILPWAQQLHAARVAERQVPLKGAQADVAKAKADADAAKIRAQKARRQGSAGLKPGGQHTPGSAPAKPIRTQKDAENMVIGNSLAAMRSG